MSEYQLSGDSVGGAARTLTMGTRGSALALAQARQVAAAVERLHPGLTVIERIIRTTGDRRASESLPSIGGKGVFTLEIEAALLDGEIDFAVHSLKDLPPEMPAGLGLAAVPAREVAADSLIPRSDWAQWAQAPELSLPQLPVGAIVGTSSLRRRAMLLNLRPDLVVVDLRGNIDTRLRKLETEGLHAIVLARAGLNRLGLVPAKLADLPESWFVPAPAQGALALQARTADLATRAILMALDDAPTRAAVVAERALVLALGAGCSTPLGALARCQEDSVVLCAVVLDANGTRRIAVTIEGAGDPVLVGQSAARKLLAKGAAELLFQEPPHE